MKLRYSLSALAALAALSPAFGQVKLNDTVTVTGWATGSFQYSDNKGDASANINSLNIDGAELEAIITPPKTPVTVNVSLYYRPDTAVDGNGVTPGGSELTLLDANVVYAASSTVNITVGRFLSYLGYESFYLDQDNMITLANQQFLAPIPGYHEGIKLDYAPDKTDTLGIAVLDSVYNKPGYNGTEGDGDLNRQAGLEGYYQNTSITNLTVWAGVGYETKDLPGADTAGVDPITEPAGHTVTVGDVWATYVVDKNNDAFSAEEIYKDGGAGDRGSNWLTYFQWNIDAKTYTWFSISGENVLDGVSYVRYSVSPTYKLTNNLSVRAQYSYTRYHGLDSTYNYGWTASRTNYAGLEMIVTF